ncbi:MgtC/SapB family protein [Phenylobacterium immobile]|uniref:MgtC/SapB family protein n=1 Tax=Phenylobacterium immobile TaxID=21 RepID=UPI000AAF1C1C|nr:DUF4010 domain-containing protein [Phenylobacterium immobile]
MPQAAQSLALALAIGLLVGIERGWRRRDAQEGRRVAGVRTFALIGLLGGLAGLLGQALGGTAFAAVLICFSLALVSWKSREQATSRDLSMTGVVAGLAVFCLGAGAVLTDQTVVAGAGVVVTGLLAFKTPIHRWVTRITLEELRSAIVLLAMTLVVLPLIPDRAFGPSGAVNPHELWLLTIMLTAASFMGYAAGRSLGEGRGLVVGSLVGAVVSSTAVTFNLARTAKVTPSLAKTAAGAAALANGVMAVRIGLISAAFSPPLALRLAAPLAVFAMASVLFGLLLLRRGDMGPPLAAPTVRSPFDLVVVFKFAAVLGAVLALARTLSATFGASGLLAVAALGGLVDVDTVTIAAAQAVILSPCALGTSAGAVVLAVAMDSSTKMALGFFQGGGRFASWFSASTLGALIAAASVLALQWRGIRFWG